MSRARTMIGDRLTERQSEILAFLIEYQGIWGMPPTIREIKDVLKIHGTNGVTCHLVALERKGYIRKLHGARGIQIIDTNFQDTVWGRIPIGH